MKHAPHILLTGFGPFPGVAVNASARLAALLAKRARRRWHGAHVACATLPTEWVRGPARLGALWRMHVPDVALHFGVTARAQGFEIERTGRNQCLDAEDACGQRPAAAHHLHDGPASFASTLPLDAIVEQLKAAGIPCCISEDAGSYLCNAILYRSLLHAATAASLREHAAEIAPLSIATPQDARRHPGAGRDTRQLSHVGTRAETSVGFIHIPSCLVGAGADRIAPLPGCPLDWKQALDGAMIVLATTLDAR